MEFAAATAGGENPEHPMALPGKRAEAWNEREIPLRLLRHFPSSMPTNSIAIATL